MRICSNHLVAIVLLSGLTACAVQTAHEEDLQSNLGGTTVPLLSQPVDWDDGFRRLVMRCAPQEGQGPTFQEALNVVFTLAAAAIGGWIVAHKHIDTTTAAAAVVGGIAVTGDVATVVAAHHARAELAAANDKRRMQFLLDWRLSSSAEREKLVQTVATECSARDLADAYRRVLGPIR